MSPVNLYEQTKGCVALLRDRGFAAEAEALDNAYYGSTSGEVLDSTGATVRDLLKKPLPADVRASLKALRREVDRILRRAR